MAAQRYEKKFKSFFGLKGGVYYEPVAMVISFHM